MAISALGVNPLPRTRTYRSRQADPGEVLAATRRPAGQPAAYGRLGPSAAKTRTYDRQAPGQERDKIVADKTPLKEAAAAMNKWLGKLMRQPAIKKRTCGTPDPDKPKAPPFQPR